MTLPVMIDSGAFSAYNLKGEVELDAYIEFLHRLLQIDPNVEYINLDVIGDAEASYNNWRVMREAGLHPWPVYHVVAGEKWLERYLEDTDKIAIGAIASMSNVRRIVSLDRVWTQYLVDKENMPLMRVHGLGVAAFSLMRRYPWWSIDSTSWMSLAIYGKVWIPRRVKGGWKYDDSPCVVSVSSQSPRQKERGEHVWTLPAETRRIVDEYFEYVGVTLGRSEVVEGEEIVVEEGLTNNVYLRSYLNALFLSKFCQTLEWPRPLEVESRRSLL